MVELDDLFLPQLLGKVAVKLLFVPGILQCFPDQVNLMHVKLHIIPAPDHGEDGNRFLRIAPDTGRCLRRFGFKLFRKISLLEYMLLSFILGFVRGFILSLVLSLIL